MSEAEQEKQVLAAEYVLGTLDNGGRANARMLMAIDPDFVESVERWERRLGELHALIEPVEPSPQNWEWIKARIAIVEPRSQIWLPSLTEAAAPLRAAKSLPPPLSPSQPASDPGEKDGATASRKAALPMPAPRKSTSRRSPGGLALLSLALALAVILLAALREFRPDILPQALRPTPLIVEKPVEVIRQVVREVPSQRFAEFVATFQEGAAPAFLLSVDSARGLVSVRRLGARAAAESHQLWIMTSKEPQPRSLGLLDGETFTVLREPPGYDPPLIAHATFGISVEPAGGSPSGQPTGKLLTAKLVQTIPGAFPAVAP